MLKRFAVENYRSCLRTDIDLHPRLSVLIGPNSSGKTNILQAIMLLNKLVYEDEFGPSYRDAITVRSRIKATFQQRSSQIQLNALVDTYTDDSNNDVMVSSRQKWAFKGKDKKASFEIPLAFAAEYGLHTEARRHLTYIRRQRIRMHYGGLPKWPMSELTRLATFCAGIKYYGASQFTNPGSCPVSLSIEQEGNRRRLFRERGHARILYNMYTAQLKPGGRGYQEFIDIVGPKGLRLIDDLKFMQVPSSSIDYSVQVGGRIETRKRDKLLVIPQFRIGKQKLSPNQLSEGTFKTLALLFYVINEDSSVLLIEEPEVCVHHGLLSSILELIKNYSKRKQMILSTHSDYVLDHVDPDNVYRVSFERGSGTNVRHIPESMTSEEFLALKSYLDKEGNLGEYWREGGLGDRP